ncbi:MAG: GTP cyclohydrolase I [Anaerolineales bacterium]
MNIHDDPEDIEYQTAMKLQSRQISDEQFHKFEGYAAEIFSAFGLDLNTAATKDTPRRFIKALFDSTEGYDGDPKLLRVFDTECRGEPDCRLSQVIEGPIPFFALCEHHALPFYGKAYVGYIAHENIVGISKLTRLVRLFAKRFFGAGAHRATNCGHARNHASSAWRSRLSRSASSLHGDARRARGLADHAHHRLARTLRRRPDAPL